MNSVTLIGNLTRDPEISATPSGVTVCKFSIAVSRNFTNGNGERETDFFNIVVWRTLAENCGKYLAKGKKAAIRGRLENRSYEDREGNKRTVTEVIAEEVEFLSPKTEATSEATEADKTPKPPKKNNATQMGFELKPVESDDLPF